MELTLAERVSVLRKRCAMSQEDLADKVGISRTSVANIETGRTNCPSAHVAIRLAEAMGVSLNLLIKGYDE